MIVGGESDSWRGERQSDCRNIGTGWNLYCTINLLKLHIANCDGLVIQRTCWTELEVECSVVSR